MGLKVDLGSSLDLRMTHVNLLAGEAPGNSAQRGLASKKYADTMLFERGGSEMARGLEAMGPASGADGLTEKKDRKGERGSEEGRIPLARFQGRKWSQCSARCAGREAGGTYGC